MTPQEWLESQSPSAMLDHLRSRGEKHLPSDRKLRLFACGFQRLHWHRHADARCRRAVEITEQYADGRVKRQALSGVRREAWKVWYRHGVHLTADDSAWDAARCTATRHHEWGASSHADPARPVCELLRCVFDGLVLGRHVPASVRSETVRLLATGIYAERAFDRMPILADALEETGCDDPEVLSHCRGSMPHARGCWVVDGILGKE